MKTLFLFSSMVFIVGCSTADSPYEGQLVNNLCALEVYPVKVNEIPDSLKISADSLIKTDPFVRQNGLMVCRSY